MKLKKKQEVDRRKDKRANPSDAGWWEEVDGEMVFIKWEPEHYKAPVNEQERIEALMANVDPEPITPEQVEADPTAVEPEPDEDEKPKPKPRPKAKPKDDS